MRLWRRTRYMYVALLLSLVLMSACGTLSAPNSLVHGVVFGVAAQNQGSSNATVRNDVRANAYALAEPPTITSSLARSAVTSVSGDAVPVYVLIAIVIGSAAVLLYLYARPSIGGPGEDKQKPAATRAWTVFNLAWYELLAIFLVLVGEGLLFAGYSVAGVGVQALNIVVVAVIVVALHGERVQLVQALALISVFRVVNLSFVLVPEVTLYWLAVIYGVMYLPLIAVIIHEKMSRYDLGIANVRRSVLLFPLGAVVGTGFAFIEYAILANNALIPNASASELIQLIIVMVFFVAIVEELLFRVLLQPQLISRSGAVVGILFTSAIFGAMHAGYGNGYELLFAFGAGVVLGVAFYKTRDLALVVTINAFNNIVLFGMLGFFPQ